MSNPIRILNLFTIMNRGGAETMVMNYYRHLDRNKIQFDFMVHREQRGAYDDEIESLGGKIYRMSPIAPQNLLKYKQQLKDFFDEHDEYKIIHSHMSELGVFVFKEAIRHNIPIRICHAHSSPNFSIETFKEKLKVIPREILAREMRTLATDFFICSKNAGDWLFGKKNEDRFIMMNNAIDAKKFSYNKCESLSIKKTFGFDNLFVIGHVGRLIVPKNHVFLLDIFSMFHKKHPNSILVLVGDGDQRKNLEMKTKKLGIENFVRFLGTRSDTYDLYKAMDVFVFPSLYEGLPVSLIEAQAAGLPSIVSDTISKQAKILDIYNTLSLNAGIEVWIECMENFMDFRRENTIEYIKKAGFDITENAEWLTNYYLNRLKSV